MPRQFPTYILNEEGFLIRTIFPKFIAHIPNDHPVTEEMKVLQWWDDADDKKKEQTIHHAKKWFVYHDDDSFGQRFGEYLLKKNSQIKESGKTYDITIRSEMIAPSAWISEDEPIIHENKKTHNVLSFDDLILEYHDPRSIHDFESAPIVYYSAELKASVNFFCKGNLCFEIKLTSFCDRGFSPEDVLRKCIERFLNNEVQNDGITPYNKECHCDIERHKIDAIKVKLQEPFKSLFYDLYNNQKWEMPEINRVFNR